MKKLFTNPTFELKFNSYQSTVVNFDKTKLAELQPPVIVILILIIESRLKENRVKKELKCKSRSSGRVVSENQRNLCSSQRTMD